MTQVPEPPETIFPLHAITRRLKELLVEVDWKRFWVQAQFVPENGGRLIAQGDSDIVTAYRNGSHRYVATTMASLSECDLIPDPQPDDAGDRYVISEGE